MTASIFFKEKILMINYDRPPVWPRPGPPYARRRIDTGWLKTVR